MTAFLKASTDGSSMIWFDSEFQSLIVCARKLCLYLGYYTCTLYLGWYPVASFVLRRMEFVLLIDWSEITLNIIVSRAIFLLFSSGGYFKSFKSFVTVPEEMIYSFLTKRAALLCILSNALN